MIKFISPIIIFALLSIIAVTTGCEDNNGGNILTLTENDFASDPTLRADPESQTIVMFLETPASIVTQNDTGDAGDDVIPLTYRHTLEQTLCWEDDDNQAGHYMDLDDIEGKHILRINVNGECVTKLIEAGDYVITIHHDERTRTTYPVFIIPEQESGQISIEKDGLIKGFKNYISETFRKLQSNFIQSAMAQNSTPLKTLITTRKCIKCNLSGADLSSRDLSNVDLEGADLSKANMSNSKFIKSNLTSANLTGANLLNTDFTAANFAGATLNSSDYHFTNFSFAKWTDGSCECMEEIFTLPIVDTSQSLPPETEPVSVVVSPDASSVYLADYNSNTLSVISTSTNTIGNTVSIGVAPVSVAVSPNGLNIFVAETGMVGMSKGSFTVLDSSPGNAYENVDLETVTGLKVVPRSVAVSPDSSYIYLAHSGNAVAVLDINGSSPNEILNNIKVVANIDVGSDPLSLAVSPDGSIVYAALSNNSIAIININEKQVKGTISVSAEPVSLVVSPDGSGIYASLSNNEISVIDTKTNTVIKTIPVGNDPRSIALSPDGYSLYVPNYKDNNLSVIETSSDTVIGQIGVGTGPESVALSPVSSYPLCNPFCVYVANSSSNTMSTIVPSVNSCRGCQ